jgi:hypothetical protein
MKTKVKFPTSLVLISRGNADAGWTRHIDGYPQSLDDGTKQYVGSKELSLHVT